MTREDDPEVRIRELERSLGAEAPAAESATRRHRHTGTGTVVRRIKRAALALAAPAAAAALFFAGDFSDSSPSEPITKEHLDITDGRSVVISDTTVMDGPWSSTDAASQAGPGGAPLSVAGVGAVKSLVCDGNTVMISGASNSVTITGVCTTLLISGIGNTVVLDTATKIVASGFDNRVTYHLGAPEVVGADESNVIVRG